MKKRYLWIISAVLIILLAFLNPYLAGILAVACVWLLKD
ncbi:putative lipoprotein [Streptococcus macacae NCTC 11558]|uniref:Lipoprotein n=1 Tax=Streptococcus macacae NCTC 11558 TaxID=764298 RepID=G5JXB2_9STRE|nr:putative lipoprotein [Streptococcus macacae NCTC 11558]